MSEVVPVIDISPALAGDKAAFSKTARAIDDALCSIGFFVLAGHGISQKDVSEIAKACRGFFDLSTERKNALHTAAHGSARGYIRFGVSALARTMGETAPADYKESYGMGPPKLAVGEDPKFYAPNVWPTDYPVLQSALDAYYAMMEKVSAELLHLFAAALSLKPEYFDEAFVGHNSTVRVINYPEQDNAPEPGQLRAGAHTDYGAFTILLGEDVPGGLQVKTRRGEWLDVRAPAGTFVINIGDLMMRWTNDRWLSNLHRVANPPLGNKQARRQSIAYFANPRENVMITTIGSCVSVERPEKHSPILAGEHRLEKIKAAGTGS